MSLNQLTIKGIRMQNKFRTIVSKHKYSILLCGLFAFFYVFPLLIANVFFTDDMRRSLSGLGWKYDGRHFASFLMSKLTGGGRISDFFPYSTIFAAFIFALAGYIISFVLGLEKGAKLKFSTLILLINPFLLENLSYRWDAIPMALSVLTVVVPFLFISSFYRFTILSVIGLCLTLFMYQASVVIYPLMVLVMLVHYSISKKKLSDFLNLLKLSVLSAVVALVLYKLLSIALPVLSIGERGLPIFFGKNFVSDFTQNAEGAWLLIKSAFSRYYTYVFILSVLLGLWGYMKFVIDKGFILNKVLIPICTFLILITIPAILLFLKDPWHVARILVGFPFLLYLLLMLIDNVSPKAVSIISVLFIFLALPLMSAYANALKSQNSLEVSVAQNIVQTVHVDGKLMAFDGKLQFSPETHVALEKFPLLEHIVPSYMNKNWMWGSMIFNRATNYMFDPQFVQGEEYFELIKMKEVLPAVDETYYYTLRADSTRIIVDFDDSRINRK